MSHGQPEEPFLQRVQRRPLLVSSYMHAAALCRLCAGSKEQTQKPDGGLAEMAKQT